LFAYRPSIATENIKELRGSRRTSDLKPNRTLVWIDRQYKLQEATAAPFSVDRFGGCGQEFARRRKSPAKTAVDRRTFLSRRQ
jgi:hypothetical protein